MVAHGSHGNAPKGTEPSVKRLILAYNTRSFAASILIISFKPKGNHKKQHQVSALPNNCWQQKPSCGLTSHDHLDALAHRLPLPLIHQAQEPTQKLVRMPPQNRPSQNRPPGLDTIGPIPIRIGLLGQNRPGGRAMHRMRREQEGLDRFDLDVPGCVREGEHRPRDAREAQHDRRDARVGGRGGEELVPFVFVREPRVDGRLLGRGAEGSASLGTGGMVGVMGLGRERDGGRGRGGGGSVECEGVGLGRGVGVGSGGTRGRGGAGGFGWTETWVGEGGVYARCGGGTGAGWMSWSTGGRGAMMMTVRSRCA